MYAASGRPQYTVHSSLKYGNMSVRSAQRHNLGVKYSTVEQSMIALRRMYGNRLLPISTERLGDRQKGGGN